MAYRAAVVMRSLALTMAVSIASMAAPNLSATGLAHAQGVESGTPRLSVPCPVAEVKTANRATITTSMPSLALGTLFSEGGHFAAREVDRPCDPVKVLGPFPVSQGGRLVASIVGEPPVPDMLSGGNSNSSLRITFEPLVGNAYGRAQDVVVLTGQAANNRLAGEGTWDGPGRLWAYIGPPGGSAPLTTICYEQSYSASAEIVEAMGSAQARAGLAVMPGDVITTDDSGPLTLALPGNGASLWVGPNSEVTLEAGQTAAETRLLAYPEWKRELVATADRLAAAGYIMPRGYREDDIDFWFGYREATLQEAHNRVSALSDPCEAAVELKLFLESRQGQWTMINAADKSVDLASDLALIWLLPNEWNAVESIVKWALRPVPILGQIANLKNASDTWGRLMKELVTDAYNRRAEVALRTIEMSRGWTPEQVTQRTRDLEAEIAASEQAVTAARQEMESALRALEAEVTGLGCGAGFPLQGAQERLCLEAVEGLRLGRARLQAQFRAVVRREMAKVLDAQTEISNLNTYRLPLAKGDCRSLMEAAPSGDGEGLCVPTTVRLILGQGAAHILRRNALAPLVIYVADNYIIPKGTEFTVERQGEASVVTVIDGEVDVVTGDGRSLTVYAGQEASLPEGVVSDYRADAYRAGFTDGIPLRNVPLDDWDPEPFGTKVAAFSPWTAAAADALASVRSVLDGDLCRRFGLGAAARGALARLAVWLGDGLPAGWVWQETDANHTLYPAGLAPLDSTWEVTGPGTVRITAPDGNNLWIYWDDAPRLLHKVSGDFDLEADLLLECAGLHLAMAEFLLYAPGRAAGYLAGQFHPEGLKAHYLIVGGGWYRSQNLNRLTVVNRPYANGSEPPEGPVRVRLTRRGDAIRTYWSLDEGRTWNLSSRQVLEMPETIWAGWVVKRVAEDGLHEEPAVATLSSVTLRSAPLGSMPDEPWDVVAFPGSVVAMDTALIMSQDGTQTGRVQAYSTWTIPGDFDVVVRYEAPPIDRQPGQERFLHVAVSNNDESDQAYIGQAITPDRQCYVADMAIDGGWYRYYAVDSEQSSGRLRLTRQGGVLAAYYEQDGNWVLLGDWGGGFEGDVHLDLGLQWHSPEPLWMTVRFHVEALTTPEGVWIGPLAAEE